MKKLIICLMLFCATGAFAAGENQVATSQAYVAEELATRQDNFQKLGADTAMTYSGSTDGAVGSRTITSNLGAETNTSNTSLPTVGGIDTKLATQQDKLDFSANTVLVNTGVAGTPDAKAIYDDTDSYATQQNALIDAATLNAAVQTAINSELVCAERKDPNDPNSPCYLFDIVTPVAQSRNLFDVSKLPARHVGGYGTIFENNGDGTITVTDGIGSSTVNIMTTLGTAAPGLIPGNTYTLNFTTTGCTNHIYLGDPVKEKWARGTSKTITQDMLNVWVYFYACYNGETPSTATISNIQIEEGTVATPYQPYGQNTYLPQNAQ